MNDIMREFAEKLKEMLKEAGLPNKKVFEVFEDNERNKKDLNAILCLNEDNGYRKEIVLDMSDAEFDKLHPSARQIFDRIPGWNGGWSPTTGKIIVGKDKVNITKFLAKQLAEKAVHEDYIRHLYNLLKIDPANPKAESQIVPKFGELINKKTDNVVIISTNPLDYFTSSAQDQKYAAFRSCFRPGGEYFNGCNSFARDGFTTITYKASNKKPDYKHGRAWMFVLDEMVAQTKSYGTFTGNERRTAREYAEYCLATKLGVDPKDFKGHHVQKWSKADNRSVLYFDDYDIDLGYLGSKFGARFEDRNTPKLIFSKARCLKCGRETLYPQHGQCGVCAGQYVACKHCDTEIMGDIRSVNAGNDTYCTACATKVLDVCGDCGNYFEKGKGTDTCRNKCVCPTCIGKNYYTCNCCGELHYKTRVKHNVAVDGGTWETWCTPCYTAKAFACEDCGVNHKIEEASFVTTAIGGTIKVCGGCAKEYHTCVDCDVAFKGGYTTKKGEICGACYANYDFCARCGTIVHKSDMAFDGNIIACKECAKKDATNEAYVEEVAAILADVAVAEGLKKDVELEMLQMIIEDRRVNGYQDGDIVRIIANNSWHAYQTGNLVVISQTDHKKEGIAIYKAVSGDSEWYMQEGDLEFARPAIVAGDSIIVGKTTVEVIGVGKAAKTGEITYSVAGSTLMSSAPTIGYIDLVDMNNLTPQINYLIGDVLEITGNASHHPFKEGDKVKVIHTDFVNGMPRFFVSKGKVVGAIYGIELDTAKVVKAEAKPKVSKMPLDETIAKMGWA